MSEKDQVETQEKEEVKVPDSVVLEVHDVIINQSVED